MFEFSWVHILLWRIISWLTSLPEALPTSQRLVGTKQPRSTAFWAGHCDKITSVVSRQPWEVLRRSQRPAGVGGDGDGGVTGCQALLAESPKPRARVLSMMDGHRLAGPQVSDDLRGCEAQPGLRRHIGRAKRMGKKLPGFQN